MKRSKTSEDEYEISVNNDAEKVIPMDENEEEIGLTKGEIDHFIQEGFVMLKNAFPHEVAAKCREFLWQRIEKDGILPHSFETWPEKHWISGN